jgi:transcriptional regulator with XRE-family HTH domain
VGDPVSLPDAAWHRAEVRDAATARDIPALLRYAQHYTGASQGRLAAALGMAQGRVNEVLNRHRAVTSLEVFERVAEGLGMPDDVRMLLGLAPLGPHAAFPLASLSEVTAIYPSQAAASAEIRLAAASASQVDVLAVRGLGILGLNDGLLRGPLTRERAMPLRLRVLVLHPGSPAAHQRARQIGETPESFAAAALLSERKIRDLAQHAGVQVEVYRYRTAPIWRIISTDDTLFVGTFDQLREGHASPVYRLPQRVDGTLYRAFRRVIEDATASAERLT